MAENNRSTNQLNTMQVQLKGEWTAAEADRVLQVFQRLLAQSEQEAAAGLFNDQGTTLRHSGRPGRVGRTRGPVIFLDNDWTDWTLAHELGHRWNNAWGRSPERRLQKDVRAGRGEWIKAPLRRFEKWLERALKSLGFKGRIDWQALWYHPGDAPPPCGVDRNFNASEDLAESFAASIFPADARERAAKATKRQAAFSERWDWTKQFEGYEQTPRGQATQSQLRQRFATRGKADHSKDQ